jgi:hypothetical protein
MATKTADGWTPLTKVLSKQVWDKLKVLETCINSDTQTSKGMVNQSPSAKTMQAEIEYKQAQAEYQKEIACPTVANPC